MIANSRRLNAWLRICLLVIAVGAAPLFAQISFNDFSNVSGLALNGTNGNVAQQVVNSNGLYVLRLTPDATPSVSGTAWFQTQQQSVSAGFTTAFQFQITYAPGNELVPADGIAFVIQNSSGSGQGTAAAGASGSAIGYGTPDVGQFGMPIPNSIAIEFDTYQNIAYDPNANHIAVQSCGTDPNTQDHDTICPDGNAANLGIVSDLGGITLADGNVHTAVLQYDPGVLSIFVDNFGTPLLVVNVNLSTQIGLNNGSAWVGFTGANGGNYENNDILSWNFTPATSPTTINQTLTPSPTPVQTDYVFGSYDHKLQYSNANSGDGVAVTATPITQATFDSTRLSGTPFSNAQCVIYDGTGGLCVYFEVNCSQTQGNDCTSLNYDLFNSFNTSQNITGACLLKAPIGTNNWQNIIETFTQTRYDPGTHGSSKGFSDFVVAQNCTALPTVNITSPANGSTVIVGQSYTIGFTCATDPNAPLVTITSCTGVLNGNPVTNGQQVTFNQVGSGSLVVTATDSVQDTNTLTSNFTVGQVPTFTSANNATFQVGSAGSFTVSTTGFPAASITETGPLPNGVTLVSHGDGTATLGGTPGPNTGGVYNITVQASNSAGNTMQGFTLTVVQTPAITSPNNTAFQVGVQGTFTVTTTGFPTASLSESGALPGGVGFQDNGNGTGTLSGIPGSSGTFNVTLTASNTAGSAMQTFTLTVVQTPAITSPNNTTFQLGVLGSFTVTTIGYPTPSLTESGGLPGNVGFHDNGNGTGTLTGTPTNSGTFNISFKASNSSGSTTQSFTLTVVQAPAITSPNNTTFQVGVLGSFTVTTTGYPAPSLTESGGLPGNVNFHDNGNGTGTLTGTPTNSGTFNITFSANNTAGTAMQTFTLTVVQTPVITSANNTTFQLGKLGSFTVTTTGYPTPSLTESGTLPGNVGFHDNGNGTGTLSGTPTNSGTFNISFTASNSAGSSKQNFTLTVSGGVQVSFSPSSINFGNVRYGNLVWQNVTVENTGSAPLQFNNIYITPGHSDPGDFSFFSWCGWSLPPGRSCYITVYFFADDPGQRTSTLEVSDNAPNSPQGIPLSGNVVQQGH